MNQNCTVGLNGFIKPNIQFQFNCVMGYIDDIATANTNAAGQAAGALSGAMFTGNGLMTTLGTRMDISF